ncbi:UNVERIFIED_CONTAM: hypothetical protein Sradi_6817900 [Sesamum radiatum]|uniref:Uncharacterized protein n=1 Tax=Sesamum radiatum TaxID=300843 RepID=A0AAW2JU72_SESRA
MGDVLLQWLARLEYLQKGLQDVQYQVMAAPTEERTGIPFSEGVMGDELPINCHTLAVAEYDGTTDPQKHLSRLKNAPCCTDTLTALSAKSSSPHLHGRRSNGSTSYPQL